MVGFPVPRVAVRTGAESSGGGHSALSRDNSSPRYVSSIGKSLSQVGQSSAERPSEIIDSLDEDVTGHIPPVRILGSDAHGDSVPRRPDVSGYEVLGVGDGSVVLGAPLRDDVPHVPAVTTELLSDQVPA